MGERQLEGIERLTGQRMTCNICGNPIGYGEPFFWDAHTCFHIACTEMEGEA